MAFCNNEFDTKQCKELWVYKDSTAFDIGLLNYYCKWTLILLKACSLYPGILILASHIISVIMLMKYGFMLKNVRVIYDKYLYWISDYFNNMTLRPDCR